MRPPVMAAGAPMDTIPAFFTRQAERFASRPLFFVKRQGRYQPVTWRQAAADAQALSLWLLGQGIQPGERVLILSENRPEWGIADLAILSIGAWSVPIYPTLTAPALQAICSDCEPVCAVASSAEQVAKLLEACRTVPSLRRIVVLDAGEPGTDERLVPWLRATAEGRAQAPRLAGALQQRMAALQPTATATLIYTSGTTGEPKGVMLSHKNFLSNVRACLEILSIGDRDLHLSFLPLSHVFERMAGWYLMLTVGAIVAYAETMDTIGRNMAEIHPTVVLGVPRFFEKFALRIQEGIQQQPAGKRRVAEWALRVGRSAQARRAAGRPLSAGLALQWWAADRLVFQGLRRHLGGRLRFFVSGSAPLSTEIGEFFDSLGLPILEGYGLTETSPVIAVNRLPRPRFGSVGKLVPGVEVRIADDGEILTRGPHVMQGYYRKPEATAAAIIDGWFHTGDIGRMDSEGYLYVTDRKKDLIKTAGGKFVAPQKLELLFAGDPAISQAFVFGDRRPYCVALIVPRAEALRRYVAEQGIAAASPAEWVQDPRVQAFYWSRVQAQQAALPSFEQVKKIALLEHEFSQAGGELTPTLKAKRGIIASRYAAVLEQLYETSSG